MWTNNSVIFQFHSLVGRNMFELMHRTDVRFYGAPHKQFWFDLHQLIVTARKRLADRQRLPNDSNGLVVRARDARAAGVSGLADSVLRRARAPARHPRVCPAGAVDALGDDAAFGERTGHVHHRRFASKIGQYLREILALMATKYFGYTRAQAYDPAFALEGRRLCQLRSVESDDQRRDDRGAAARAMVAHRERPVGHPRDSLQRGAGAGEALAGDRRA